MTDQSSFSPYLVVWIALAALCVWRSWYGKYRGVGLVIAYCLQLWLFYWLPSLLHYLPWSHLPENDVTLLGFEQSTYALAALLVGSIVAGPLFAYSRASSRTAVFYPDPRLPGAYIVAGVFSILILGPVLRRIPSLSALAGLGQQLMIVGFCLACWQAWRLGSGTRALSSLGPLLLLPAMSVIGTGFLGTAFITITVVFIFVAQFFRPRSALMIGSLVVGYLGVSLFVTYMRDRNEIRSLVWGGATFSARINRFAETLVNFELFDVYNSKHLLAVDGRLNQASLVGAGVNHLKDTGAFAHGESLRQALLAMIPRIIWPGKSVYAGSGDWATRFTGITFAEGTSVGLGQVLEFYGNFGTRGVLWGFFLLGVLLSALDMAAAAHLGVDNWQGFAFMFVIGTSLLQAGGSLVEITASAVACIFLMYFTNSTLVGYQKVIHKLRGTDVALTGNLK